MKSERSALYSLTAIGLIVWLLVPFCCCTAETSDADGSLGVSCCSASNSPDADGEGEDHDPIGCPCGKKVMGEPTQESVTFGHSEIAFALALLTPTETFLSAKFSDDRTHVLTQSDLPPPGRWHALAETWLL